MKRAKSMQKMIKPIKPFIIACLSFGIFVLGACSLATGGEEPVEETDSAAVGEELSLAVTSVAICEILDELEYDNVIGVPETSEALSQRYDGITTVGALMTPDYEILASLEPDLVLSPISLESSLSADYNAAGLNSAFLDLSSVEGMYSAISSLGELLDRQEQAQGLLDEYEAYMASYETASEGESPPTVLILMCFPDGFYLVATDKSYAGNLVDLAGGVNVYTDYEGDTSGYMSVNTEDMVQRKPDKILVFAHYSEEAAFAYMEEEFATNEAWQYYDAVLEDEIYYLSRDYFAQSATLAWTDGLDYLWPILYGE